MKKRSLLALFLACTLALGLLAGCGGGNAGKNTGGDAAGGGDKDEDIELSAPLVPCLPGYCHVPP